MQRRTFVGALCAGALAQGQTGSQDVLYLLTYDHGGLVLWGISHFIERLRNAVSWLDRYPGFKIGLENEAHTYDQLAEQEPEVLEEIRRYLREYEGRFGIGTCTYGQPLSCFINEESNIRQLEYGREATLRHFGRAPGVYLMSEHAMHSQLPQILSSFGFRSAIMRTHYMMYGYNPTFDAAYGRWIGADGSQIPAIPTYPGEGAEFAKTTYDNWVLTRCPGPECRGSLDEFREKFGHLRPLIATRADDSGLRREDLVRITEGRNDCRWILLEDLSALLPEPAADMRTGPNDFVVRMPWGYCGNEIFNRTRKAETSVLMAERLAALELMAGGENREPELERAWKNVLVAQHHDIQICGLLPDARKYLGASIEASERVAQDSMRALAARMKGGEAAQVTVFNPSSWPRREWVEATFTLPPQYAKAVEIRHKGEVVPSVLISALRGSSDAIQEARVLILADAPPLGLASYSVAAASGEPARDAGIEASSQRIETPFWRVELDADGGIASLNSRRTGAEMLERGRRSCFFAARVDGKRCESKGRWRILPRAQNLPWVAAREEGETGGIPYRCDLKLWANSPRMDYRVTFEFENQKIGRVSDNRRDGTSPFVHEEKLRFKLYPAAGANAAALRDLPFAIAETDNRYIDGNYWTAVYGHLSGVAVFNRGTMGSVRETDGGLSVPLAYSMYYIWGTRILSGEYTYEFALWPFEGRWQQADLHRHALEYNYPLMCEGGLPGDGSLGEVYEPIGFASEDVLATALYSKQGSILLRMFEHRGGAASAHVARAERSGIEEVSLDNRVAGSVGAQLDFHPWQIRTVRFDVRRPDGRV